MLSSRDAWMLEKALSIGVFEKSTMGGILDHAELYSEHEPHSGIVDARPTAEVRQQAKSEPDGELLALYGTVSRRLQRVAEQDATCAAVLIAFHGDSGSKHACAKHGLGRMGALVRFTNAGRELVRQGAKKARAAKLKLTPEQRVDSELELQQIQPVATREVLIGRALAEAQALYREACELWNANAPEKRTSHDELIQSGGRRRWNE